MDEVQYKLKDIGLVLEGGGMRGVFTAGVLDYLMERKLYFPYVVGVSAGACHAASYISRQKGRNKVVNIGYIQDPRYISYGNLITQRSLIGMDFVFDEIPHRLVPFDFETFNKAKEQLVIGTTDCYTGKPVYFAKGSCDVLQVLRASSSLPFISPMVKINGQKFLDGGMSDPIPIRKALADGYNRNLLVLTKPPGYRLKPLNSKWLAKIRYVRYPGLVNALITRHQVYNQTLELVEKLQAAGKVFVIQPKNSLAVKRLEKDPAKLGKLYDEGYREAKSLHEQLISWILQ